MTENISDVKDDKLKLVIDKVYNTTEHGIVRLKELTGKDDCKVDKNGELIELKQTELYSTMCIVVHFAGGCNDEESNFILIKALIDEPLLPQLQKVC